MSGAKFHVSIGHSTILSTITLFSQDTGTDDTEFSYDNQYAYVPSLSADMTDHVYALIEFDRSTVIALNSKVLGSKLDTDVHTTSCRLAFEGQMLLAMTCEKYKSQDLVKLKVFKRKEKKGVIERANNDLELIGKNMFKKETNIPLFNGFKVTLSSGSTGLLDGRFGQSGKFKVRLTEPLSPEEKAVLGANKKKKEEQAQTVIEVRMPFKKYIFSKEIAQ